MNPYFSFILLTHNEAMHLPRLLESLRSLCAYTFVLDSGSTDQTLDIAAQYGAIVKHHPFVNHPKQWNAALTSFDISTPWVICLDADQVLSPDLIKKLHEFRDEDYPGIHGIYFNRKNYFKGKWIKHGGYYPKYLLKMFRYASGYSDLSENMDHRFQVQGKTLIWKNTCLIESNLKENNISFWISKHNIYSDLLAEEEIIRNTETRGKPSKVNFFGSPNERNAWLKILWRKTPLYLRPFLYFIYRFIFQLGFLDGKEGIVFHFLQGFWFRLIVDIKIEEKRTIIKKQQQTTSKKFLFFFFLLFITFYMSNIFFIGITNPKGIYFPDLDRHFNYISKWRSLYISLSAYLLEVLGYEPTTCKTGLSVKGFSGFRLVYSCLGYGIMSCFSAFVISFPKPFLSKVLFLFTGLLLILVLNTCRFILLAIYYKPEMSNIDHHTIFNCTIYLTMIILTYIWTNRKN